MWLDIKGKSLHTFSYNTNNCTYKNLVKTTTWILPILNSNLFLVGTEDGVEEYDHLENKFELKQHQPKAFFISSNVAVIA